MEAAVELKGVSKRFGTLTALHPLSLSIAAREVVALLGPNGAGKTTAISLMLGLRMPSTGRVRLLGLDPRDLHARSRVGIMLQESGVPPNLRVRETVDLFRSYYPQPLPGDRAIEMAGLAKRARAFVQDLSGGERQRLYYALAVCGNPQVLFLDEPTVGMDVESRRSFWTGIRQFVNEGKTIVLTTHYIEEADELATRVVVINEGRVIADANPTDIKARFGGKRISFHPARPLDDAVFTGLPIARLEITGQQVRLITTDPDAVLRALFQRGVEMRDLEVVGADLEEAFLHLTTLRAAACA